MVCHLVLEGETDHWLEAEMGGTSHKVLALWNPQRAPRSLAPGKSCVCGLPGPALSPSKFPGKPQALN